MFQLCFQGDGAVVASGFFWPLPGCATCPSLPDVRLSNPLPSSVPSMDSTFRARRTCKPARPETMLRQKNDYGKL
jgi:hypothetical protein